MLIRDMRLVATLQEPKVLSAPEVERLCRRLAEACRDLPVVLLYLHGSHAHGTQTRLSDLDLAVLLDRAALPGHDVLFRLEEICERDDVDFVVLNRAGPIIKDRVVRHGRLVHARSERDRVVFEAHALKEAMDYRPFSRAYDDAMFRQIREGRFLD
ncbi:MAG: nucleotidyltransferase domain-containing protein [Planctomycetes bacterium]|nr:nucleotidyltransferase domain-containing protein [Planctomycetota bacterium]MBM4144601.1 nucleotidyltransferase domain-containing protein [Lentisphaerota bacterium]